ncbi:DUF192 domain-containing protein [bacterium]
MKSRTAVFTAAIAAALMCAGCFGGCGGGSSTTTTPATVTVDVTVVNSSAARFTVVSELALTPQEQARGLQNRTSLGENDGMLFVFEAPKTASFWMKDTLIPLDMMFITENGGIVDINENAQPGDLTPFVSSAPVKYVLEVNGGWCTRNGVATGDTVITPEGY